MFHSLTFLKTFTLKTSPLKVMLLSLFLLNSAIASAEQFKQFSNLEVHYIALPSTFIQPEITTQYKIKRSNNNGLLNISVLDKKKNKQAVEAVLTGTGKNLIGQTHQLVFTEVKEGDAIYYLAEYPYTNEEIVNFDINIKTKTKSNTLKFQHKFYVE